MEDRAFPVKCHPHYPLLQRDRALGGAAGLPGNPEIGTGHQLLANL